jgi:hypothetical protein
MTLLLSCLTPAFVITVSDRRLTRAGTLFDDERNKAVSWCHNVTLSFTGLAYLDQRLKERTDHWIAQTLRGQSDVNIAGRVLAKAAQEKLRLLSFADKRLAIMMAGFLGSQPRPTPFGALISNFHDSSGQQLSVAQPNFVWSTPFGPLDRYLLHSAGVPLASAETEYLNAAIRYLVNSGAGPDRVARAMVQIVRRVADRSALVGRSLMITSVPLESLGSGLMTTNRRGWPDLQGASFFYVPVDRDDPVAFGPVSVCGDGPPTEVEVRYLNESGSGTDIRLHFLR